MFEMLTDYQIWVSLLTLTALEIVLGIDNLIFLSIVSGRLPKHQQQTARRIGLALALLGRLVLLFSLTWIIGLTEPIASILGFDISWRDVVQIIFLDVVFALDSIITAVGMVEHLWVMVVAVVIAMIIMLVAADPVGNFVNNHPTVKMLALSFLLLVGVALVADGLHFHIPRGYLYFAIAFSALVEALNLIAARRRRRFRLKASGEIVDEMMPKDEMLAKS